MKINSKIENITNNRQTLSVKVKLFFQNCNCRLKTLIKDVFQKEKTIDSGKQYISRNLPNSIGGKNDIYNERGGFLNFFEEDLKKMEKMTENEIKDFQKELINEGRYKLEFISKNKPDNIN